METVTESHEATSSANVVLNLPNILTLSRLGLALILFYLISEANWLAALTVFICAAITDWLDGYLARRQGLTSVFGRNLDPLVDKVLVCGAFIFLLPIPESALSAWMVTVVVARELIVTGLRSFFESRGVAFGADMMGKIKMVLQCATLIVIFIALASTAEQRATLFPVQNAIIWAMIASTIASGGQYLLKAAWQLRRL